MIAPRSSDLTVATFPPYNQHLLHDIGAFQIGLGTYGTSMMISLPAAEQFHYNVLVLCAGMLTLASLARSPLTTTPC